YTPKQEVSLSFNNFRIFFFSHKNCKSCLVICIFCPAQICILKERKKERERERERGKEEKNDVNNLYTGNFLSCCAFFPFFHWSWPDSSSSNSKNRSKLPLTNEIIRLLSPSFA